MSDTMIEQRPANSKADQWAERIAAQQRAGISVKQFCKEQGLTEYCFYAWRRRSGRAGRCGSHWWTGTRDDRRAELAGLDRDLERPRRTGDIRDSRPDANASALMSLCALPSRRS